MTTRASSLDAPAWFAGEAARGLAEVGDAELRQLRVFCVVVAAGGFSAATAELQADLSTVSRQFKELETRLGVRLAARGRGGFALTPAGLQLLPAAQRVLAALASYRADAAALGRAGAPVLRLGIVDALLTAPGLRLPDALAHCVDTLPGLQVQLTSLRPIEIERRILAGELEAGILAAHPSAAGLQQHRLCAEASSLYVAPGHPWHDKPACDVRAEDLAGVALVVDPYSVDLPAAVRRLLPAQTTRADSIEGVALLVRSGRFAGFLPDHLAAALAAQGVALCPVAPALFSHTQDIVLSCRRGKADVPLRTLLRALAPSAGDGM
jgi:LysR family transcriptional regulator, transcriptional activator for bauABCD operon